MSEHDISAENQDKQAQLAERIREAAKQAGESATQHIVDTAQIPHGGEPVSHEYKDTPLAKAPLEDNAPVWPPANTTTQREPIPVNAGTPDYSQAPKAELMSPRSSTRTRVLGGGLAAAVLVTGGIVAGKALFSGEEHKKAVASSPTTGKSNSILPIAPVPPQEVTSASPTSITPSHESIPVPNPNTNTLDLTTIHAATGGALNIGEAQVPQYNVDPSVDPAAALSAMLSDFSYALSTQSEVNANTALYGIAGNNTTIAALTGQRAYWQETFPNVHMWFWKEPGQTLSISVKKNADGTEILTAKGNLFYGIFPNATDQSWNAPSQAELSTAPHQIIKELRLTYALQDTSDPASPHTDLQASVINNQTQYGTLQFPNWNK